MAILGNLVPCIAALCLKYLRYLLATWSDRCLETLLISVTTRSGIKQEQSSPGGKNVIVLQFAKGVAEGFAGQGALYREMWLDKAESMRTRISSLHWLCELPRKYAVLCQRGQGKNRN